MASHPVTALVTGCAGFLGSHLSEALLADGCTVRGVDSFTDYYPRAQKESNLRSLRRSDRFTLLELDLADADLQGAVEGIDVVFHLAAQPGVRLSFGPGFDAYLRDNVEATQRLLKAAASADLQAFVYASSSSVYGDQDEYPVRESSPLRPLSPYGATKVITEQLAGSFWRSLGVPVVGLRYFTVYGPRQRPDMAFSRFVVDAMCGRALKVLGDGLQVREFTYVGDVVRATIAAAHRGEPGGVYNIGGGSPTSLRKAIALMERHFDRALAVVHEAPALGDPRRTEADVSRAERDLDYRPATSLDEGLAAQIAWLRGAGRVAGTDAEHSKAHVVGGLRSARRHPPRILAYSHDGYGLGHFRRNLRLVTAVRRLRPETEVLLATGARSADRLAARFGVPCVRLPPVVKVGDGRYVAEEGGASLSAVLAHRSALLAEAVSEFHPDLLLVDRYPRGMHGEMSAALDLHALQTQPQAAVLGLRDILDAPSRIHEEWHSNDYSRVIEEHYRMVLCYGDQDVFDPVMEYQLPAPVAARIEFTGYLADDLLSPGAAEIRWRHAPDQHLAVCTLGGGKDATPIAQSFMAAMEVLSEADWRGVLITGPYMAQEDRERLARHSAGSPVDVLTVVDDVPSYLGAADVVVSMAGYNTVCEVMGLAVPAVVIPRVEPRVEQLMRAERLGARRLIRFMEPDALSATRLAAEIHAAARVSRPALASRVSTIAHHGVLDAGGHLAALLPSTHRSRSAVFVEDAYRARPADAA